MNILGFNKLTLTDYPAINAAIVFLGGCNFRCPFCHNRGIVESEYPAIDEREILSYLEKRKNVLQGVVISGGEPLVNNIDEIADFIAHIKEMGYKIKLDTNGSFPDKLAILLDKKLVDYVAMDIKSGQKNYQKVAGVGIDFLLIKRSIALIKNSGIEHEFRTTLTSLNTTDDIKEIYSLVGKDSALYLQGFIDSGNLLGEDITAFDMKTAQTEAKRLGNSIKLR